MTTYYHCTNLQKPYDAVDAKFLSVLDDYVEGPAIAPVPGPGSTWAARSVADLTADGIVGIYTTFEALNTTRVRQLTGWQNAERVLGAAL